MGAIADLSDLFLAVSEQVKRADFANLFPRFVAMAEDKMSKAMRLDDFEVIATITADAEGRAALPSDFRRVRSVRLMSHPGRVLVGGSPDILNTTFERYGTPASFWIGGGAINLVPRAATDIELTYWTGMPRLTAAAPTNAMLDRYPDCYLYGVAYEVLLWAADLDAANTAKQLRDEAINEAAIDNEARVFSASRRRMMGIATP